jgi:hypothetical protein
MIPALIRGSAFLREAWRELIYGMSAPAPSFPEVISAQDDETHPALADGVVQDVAPAPVTAEIPRLICQDPQVGTMQWWGTHRWIWFSALFMCSRCERLWPDPCGEGGDE